MTSHEQSTSAAGQSQQEADVQPATTPEQSQDEKRECPICKMMREGGCEKEFNVGCASTVADPVIFHVGLYSLSSIAVMTSHMPACQALA